MNKATLAGVSAGAACAFIALLALERSRAAVDGPDDNGPAEMEENVAFQCRPVERPGHEKAMDRQTMERLVSEAVKEGEQGWREGGIPIGAVIANEEGEIVARGHNLRVQVGRASSEHNLANPLTNRRSTTLPPLLDARMEIRRHMAKLSASGTQAEGATGLSW